MKKFVLPYTWAMELGKIPLGVVAHLWCSWEGGVSQYLGLGIPQRKIQKTCQYHKHFPSKNYLLFHDKPRNFIVIVAVNHYEISLPHLKTRMELIGGGGEIAIFRFRNTPEKWHKTCEYHKPFPSTNYFLIRDTQWNCTAKVAANHYESSLPRLQTRTELSINRIDF